MFLFFTAEVPSSKEGVLSNFRREKKAGHKTIAHSCSLLRSNRLFLGKHSLWSLGKLFVQKLFSTCQSDLNLRFSSKIEISSCRDTASPASSPRAPKPALAPGDRFGYAAWLPSFQPAGSVVTKAETPVAVIMGSSPTGRPCATPSRRLKRSGVGCEARIVSAHRTPGPAGRLRQGRARRRASRSSSRARAAPRICRA